MLERIYKKIDQSEDRVDRADLYRILLRLFDKQLAGESVALGNREFPHVPLSQREQVVNLFDGILEDIREFQGSDIEGTELAAKVFDWVAGMITYPYHSEFLGQKDELTKKIYNVRSVMDEVPIE